MKAQDHAFDFILPIDPRYGIRKIARRIWNMADTDEKIASKFATIFKLMGSGKPLINEEHYKLYQRLKYSLPTLNIPTAPDWIRPAFAAAYLRAKTLVASGHAKGLFDDLDRRLDTVVGLVEKLEPSFVGELLTETMLAAYEDKGFVKTLTSGADEFRALVSDLYGPEGTDRPEAIARMAGGGGGGGGDCTCCTTVDGHTQCTPCSCWIIVVIIIIIIVAK